MDYPRKTAQYKLNELLLYFLKLGTIGFGGPVALIGSESEYKEGLTLAQIAPGPLAAQLAIYLGYVHYGIIGATLTGIAFVLPSFLMVIIIGWVYVHYGGISVLQYIFYGIGTSVIGIIAISAYKLTSRTIKKEWLLWMIYLTLAALTVITENENILLFIGSGVLYWLVKSPPKFKKNSLKSINIFGIISMILLATYISNSDTLIQIFLFFAKSGTSVFGSGLAIIPFLYSGVVNEFHWLNERQFIDAVAVAMITPGPVVITTGFIGYLVAGFSGAVIAAAGTFLPCYLFTIILAPLLKKHGSKPGLKAFVEGVTAAAIGAITGAVVVLARKTLIDIPTIIIAIVTILILLKFKKIQEPIIVLSAGVLGIILKSYLIK